jgi:hypothetical protein
LVISAVFVAIIDVKLLARQEYNHLMFRKLQLDLTFLVKLQCPARTCHCSAFTFAAPVALSAFAAFAFAAFAFATL